MHETTHMHHLQTVFIQDHVLLPLITEEEEDKENPHLVVHPNYVVES